MTNDEMQAVAQLQYTAVRCLNGKYTWCIVNVKPRVETIVEEFGFGPDAYKAAEAKLAKMAHPTTPPTSGEREAPHLSPLDEAKIEMAFYQPELTSGEREDIIKAILTIGYGFKIGSAAIEGSHANAVAQRSADAILALSRPNLREALTKNQRFLLKWLSKEDGQYGECHGKDLDALIQFGFAKVQGMESGLTNSFIAKGNDIMFRAVSITDVGRAALTEADTAEAHK